jgi:ABC-type lipoprotein export system ATPase subunit
LAESLSQRDRNAVKKDDFEQIVESIKIMRLESLEHNISTTYRLAREWALKLGEDEASLEEKYDLGIELYTKLVELSKGETHTETIQARMISGTN